MKTKNLILLCTLTFNVQHLVTAGDSSEAATALLAANKSHAGDEGYHDLEAATANKAPKKRPATTCNKVGLTICGIGVIAFGAGLILTFATLPYHGSEDCSLYHNATYPNGTTICTPIVGLPVEPVTGLCMMVGGVMTAGLSMICARNAR